MEPMTRSEAKEVLIPPLYAVWLLWWKLFREKKHLRSLIVRHHAVYPTGPMDTWDGSGVPVGVVMYKALDPSNTVHGEKDKWFPYYEEVQNA